MFDYFKQAKRFEIQALERLGEDRLPPVIPPAGKAGFSPALTRAAAADGLAIIAEYKRASPSQGDIALEVSPAQAACCYASSGAAAISVLTEKSKFKGRLAFIDKVQAALKKDAQCSQEGKIPPLLRKDFIFHPLQIRATAATSASALLLIVKLTPSAGLLASLIQTAKSYGLESVVEILDEDDLELARKAGAAIIQANARDFGDLSVDLNRSLALAKKHMGKGEIWIAASGLEKPEDLERVRQAGFTAALIGTALMRGGHPGEALSRLRPKFKNQG